MDFKLSEEHAMFQDAITNFADKEVAPLVNEAEQSETMPKQLFPMLGRLGYLCPGYPEEYGGGGLGKIGDCIMVTQLAKTCAGIAAGIMVQSGLSTYPLLAHGTPEQKRQYLIPAVRGDKIAAYGLTEPNAGSDSGAVQAVATEDGDSYVINGTKIYITNGTICDFVLLAAKIAGGKGISVFIVERGTPGFTANKMRKLGTHSSSTGELVFDNCRVPARCLLGEEGKGFKYMLEALNGARISHAARSLGVAEAAFEASLDYAKQRVQFGQAIGKFQAVAFKLSNMAIQIEAARSFLFRVASMYDQGDQCRKEGPMIKVFCSDLCIRVAEEAMRIHAGAGFMAESPVQRYFRDAIVAHTTEGTTELQELIIARELGLLD